MTVTPRVDVTHHVMGIWASAHMLVADDDVSRDGGNGLIVLVQASIMACVRLP